MTGSCVVKAYVSVKGKLDNPWKGLIRLLIKQDMKQQADRVTLNDLTQIILVISYIWTKMKN